MLVKSMGTGSWQIWKDLQAGESITNVKLRMTNGAVESITNDECEMTYGGKWDELERMG